MDRIFLKGLGYVLLDPCFEGSQFIIWGPFLKNVKSPGTLLTLESKSNARDFLRNNAKIMW